MEQQKLPNATAVLVLGILSILGCCFYFVGIIFSIIALVMAKKDMALYALNSEMYDNYSNLKTGRILAIIGLVLNIIGIITLVAFIAIFGWAVMNDPVLLQERLNEMQGL
ncbi:CCC motif membrane protein [Flavobacterium tegetincola]|uniref:CCC motif membrane protein n=1 Tax=Flavobacterium tegetincola TaxID=150172 RepID=UPI00041033E8|nr:CCC motif membrane protein [Flavobacterium tegetincola]